MAEPREARWKKPGTVHWYDVGQLVDTGTYVYLDPARFDDRHT